MQEDYSYKDTIVENDFICSISNDDGISIIIEIADETIVDFKDIKSSILQVRDFLLANKWSGAIPDFLPIEQKEIRNMMNETERSIPFKCLHEAFFECAYRFPDKTALEWLSLDEKWETLSYEALKIKVLQTASMLKQEGVHTRDKVAIVLPKGENQIIAVLAILSIGATYVPIGIHQPLDRKKKIFEAGNISYALTDRDHINTLDGADTLRSFLIENSFRYVVMPETEIVKDIDSIAYIIFTSGTTGIPKGVMITHKAAYNTIYDVNDKFTINEHDCAIAVSELDFDLSVYDIFGMLGYGASLIVLNEMNKREPYIWKKILCEKRVTIWNSVPALFEMFLLAIGYDYEKVTLKNILLSGDWIKLEIYPKVNKLWPECRFVSLGGATEAAIWSVYYEVHILDEPWTSIPYGRPLANQLLRVVNNKGKDSPVGVPGELWIGGYGVAEGYVNEEKLTQERFVKIDGIRWYKTGDKAQYFQDGNVQFLGRLDDQVKVNGYRIELGEIENVIKRAECIDDAIAMTVETNGKKEIVAAVVEKYEKGNASHQVFMNEENPEYAEIQEIRKKVVAAFILKVYGNNVDSLTPNDNIVINSNGKVEQYWNVWLLINNVISHKDSDEYVLNLEIKNVLSDIWYMKLETQIPMVQELIRGTVSASNLLTNGYLSPEELLVQGSDTVIFLEHVTKVIKHDSKVAVLGARTGLAVEMLLNNNLDRNVELTLIDESAGMLKRAEERLRRYDVQFEYYLNMIPFFYAHGYNVYAMSFRNHGNSERIENVDQIVVKDMVEDLIKTIDIIDGKIILIAHSLGCRIAQMCLEEIYSSIQSVVLITPMPVRNNFLQLLQMSKKQRKNNLEYILFSERLDSEQKEYYMSLLDKESKKVEYAMMKRQKKFSIYVRKIPTLVIGSYNDQCVILQAVKDNAKIHTAELKIVDSVCHDMMLDPDWRNIADLIFKFIEKTIDKKSGDNYNDNYVSTQAHQGGE